MTEKKANILKAALELFAKEGYRTTSTSKVAQLADVSEGLIFRHFKNKEGLLEAIINQGEEKAQQLFAEVIQANDPKTVIRNFLDISNKLSTNKEEADFWKLQYKIKWELEAYSHQKMAPVHQALTTAFRELSYAQPEKEASLMILYLDGIATQFFLNEIFDFETSISFLKEKYKL